MDRLERGPNGDDDIALVFTLTPLRRCSERAERQVSVLLRAPPLVAPAVSTLVEGRACTRSRRSDPRFLITHGAAPYHCDGTHPPPQGWVD